MEGDYEKELFRFYYNNLHFIARLVNFIIRILNHITTTCSCVGALLTTYCNDVAVFRNYEIHSGRCKSSPVEIEPPYDLGNYPLNSVQFGFIAKDDDWLYYMDGEDNHNITRTNGIDKETYENTYARGLNSSGDYLYFASFNSDFEGCSGFYRIHKDDPEDMEQVINYYTNDHIIVNDYIFYSLYLIGDNEENGLYRTKVDGSEEVQLVEDDILNFQWSEGWIYYGVSAGGHVYKMRSSGKDKEKIKTEDDVAISSTGFFVVDDWLYFENDDETSKFRYAEDPSTNIFRLSLIDGSVEALAKGRLEIIDDESGYVYFSTSTFTESALFQMNLDGKNKTELYRGEKNWSWINIVDKTLFLLDWETGEPSRVYRYAPDKQNLIQINTD